MNSAENPIDLRSDAITRPTARMWERMRADPLDWSKASDKTVRALEERVSADLQVEAAILLPTGTMANVLALLCRTRPGQGFVAEARTHVIVSEDQAFARLASIVPRVVSAATGHPLPKDVGDVISERWMSHQVSTTLVWLENTHNAAGGTVAPPQLIQSVGTVAASHGAAIHIDGARLFNAAVALEVNISDFVPPGASVTINLNKALSAPAGALLCGPRDLVDQARDRSLGLGGAMSNTGRRSRSIGRNGRPNCR
jgi:threonine aldolase